MTTSDPRVGRPANQFPPPTGERNRLGRHAAERGRRDTTVQNVTTRVGDNRFPLSPFWLVTISWHRERCPTCHRELPRDSTAAWDPDERACFCMTCAHRWIDKLLEHDDDPPPAPRPRARQRQEHLELR